MKNLLTIIAIVFYSSFITAQDFKYGKVSKEELAEKVHSVDASANAAVLYRNEDISFVYTQDGFIQEREVHERIKIYNKEGYNWATKKVYLYEGGGGSKEKIQSIKGTTYNLIDGKIQKDKLKKDGIFEEDYSEFTEINTITMPNIQDGAVIEYSYKISSPFIVIDDIVLQNDIPINKLDIRIATPQFYVYNKLINPKAFYSPKLNESKMKKTFVSSSSSGRSVTGTTFDTSTSEYSDNVIKVTDENIPALKEESYAGNMNNYRAKMSMELSAIVNRYGAVEKSYSSSWEKVSKSIYESPNFGAQFKRTNFFKDDVTSIVAGVEDPFQKAFTLQNYVKSKVKWNGYNGIYTQKGIRNAYKEGEGNVADINLLLITMLRSQGINANPVLVSTRSNGIPLYPTRNGFNYVVCMVQNGQNYILLDASEPYSMVNVLPERALNWRGRLVMDNGTSDWVSLRPNSQAKETTSLNVQFNDDFSVKGKVRQSMTSNVALRYRKKYASMSQDDHIKSIESGKGAIEVSEINFENANDITEPVKLSYNYELSDAIDDIGGKLYFSPMLFMATKENPFKLDERNYPIDFTMPILDKYVVNVEMPEGYKVEALPKSEIIDFKEGAAKFSYIAKENGKYLQFVINFDLKTSIIDPTDYGVFKQFFEKMIEKQAEQVVLTKA
ncbi:DUF3857 domain-containing protein [Winogradskyella immobilis]|uniref:DUF3857 domain-containing protein n=1 Tax=Winogradskyella immobilis TaxID=2816852 RepID=A0ABS8EM02_9FLAO|nr:transglutaminase domain-containing protein [Winogradskyella immobilis]MCC1483877.1 DUF3857 domain-containing protein [Winogradskyella immobilis]MCG0015970.1 DUF3857 domain-containing protein [Winogradskyella immobilis]